MNTKQAKHEKLLEQARLDTVNTRASELTNKIETKPLRIPTPNPKELEINTLVSVLRTLSEHFEIVIGGGQYISMEAYTEIQKRIDKLQVSGKPE